MSRRPGTDADRRWPGTWAPYMTWAKHHAKARFDLTGSNLLPCTLEDLPGARDALRLYARNDDGWPPLLHGIASRYGVGVERVATASGASGANFLALAATVRPGDTVLVEWPGYDPHAGAARLLGAEVRAFPRGWERGFALDPEAVASVLGPEVGAIVVTDLHNPSGVATDRDALRRVGEMAGAVGARVIVDEVYLDAAEGVDTRPAATLDDVFISTNSLTKSYGLSGLRIGWIVADPATVERVNRVRDVVDGVGPIPAETLGAYAFNRLDDLLERARTILGRGSALFRDFVASRDELRWVEPAGGSVGFPRLVGVDDAEPFVDMAAREMAVGVTPGRLFGEPAHFRVAVAGEPEILEEGLRRLGTALDRWRG